MNESPDWREVYDTLYSRNGSAKKKKKKQPRERSSEPTGFFHAPRRRKPTVDELLARFIEELEANGRGDVALDDEDGVLFGLWCRDNGFDY